MRFFSNYIFFVGLGCLLFAGCFSQQPRAFQVSFDAEEVGQTILGSVDVDQNGEISRDESKNCLAMEKRFSMFDGDGNDSIGLDEIKTGLAKIFDQKVGLLSVSCIVKRNKRPLQGAIVKFIPEDFLAEVVPEASGVVRDDGIAIIAIDDDKLPRGAPKGAGLMRAGIYRVEITHPKLDGENHGFGEVVSGETVRTPFQFNL